MSDSKTRLSRAVVETVTNGGIKGFMAGLAPRWGFIISMVLRIDIKKTEMCSYIKNLTCRLVRRTAMAALAWTVYEKMLSAMALKN